MSDKLYIVKNGHILDDIKTRLKMKREFPLEHRIRYIIENRRTYKDEIPLSQEEYDILTKHGLILEEYVEVCSCSYCEGCRKKEFVKLPKEDQDKINQINQLFSELSSEAQSNYTSQYIAFA